jgi:hypothetical protein
MKDFKVGKLITLNSGPTSKFTCVLKYCQILRLLQMIDCEQTVLQDKMF